MLKEIYLKFKINCERRLIRYFYKKYSFDKLLTLEQKYTSKEYLTKEELDYLNKTEIKSVITSFIIFFITLLTSIFVFYGFFYYLNLNYIPLYFSYLLLAYFLFKDSKQLVKDIKIRKKKILEKKKKILEIIKEKLGTVILSFILAFLHINIFVALYVTFYLLKNNNKKILIEKEIIIKNVVHILKINKNNHEFFYNKKGELHREDNYPAIVYKNTVIESDSKRARKYYYLGKEIRQKAEKIGTSITFHNIDYLYNQESYYFNKQKIKIRENIKKNKIANF